MNLFKSYIAPKVILNILLMMAIICTIIVLLSINKINVLLNTGLGFNKDSVYCLKADKNKIAAIDTLIFSSSVPGIYNKDIIEINTENKKAGVKIAHQFISDNYFDFFKYKKLIEKPDLFLNHGNAQLIYVNESALKELGICNIYDAPGTKIQIADNQSLIICGVIHDYPNLCIRPGNQGRIFQLTDEPQEYAFFMNDGGKIDIGKIPAKTLMTFQEKINKHFKYLADGIYSVFLFINIIILLTGIGIIGNKYTIGKEKELVKILGIGIHVLTLIISKTYVYLIAIIGFVAGPLALLIQKLWLEIYENRIQFGLVDLFIILSISFCIIFSVCCPKYKFIHNLNR